MDTSPELVPDWNGLTPRWIPAGSNSRPDQHDLGAWDNNLHVSPRDYDHLIFIGGRGWGKTISSGVKWPVNPPSDDRPITEVVDDHFRARFERSDSAPDVIQDLYDVPGAF